MGEVEGLSRMDDHEAFLHWFAGFVAGEAYFVIAPATESGYYYTCLRIKLRDDDLDVLLEIQDNLGIGTIHRRKPRGTSRPCAVWQVTNIVGCRRLVHIFDDHPLRAKKRRDYEVWRDAVEEMSKPMEQRDRRKLRYLYDKIRLVRQYEVPDEEVDYDYESEEVQLRLPYVEDKDE